MKTLEDSRNKHVKSIVRLEAMNFSETWYGCTDPHLISILKEFCQVSGGGTPMDFSPLNEKVDIEKVALHHYIYK